MTSSKLLLLLLFTWGVLCNDIASANSNQRKPGSDPNLNQQTRKASALGLDCDTRSQGCYGNAPKVRLVEISPAPLVPPATNKLPSSKPSGVTR